LIPYKPPTGKDSVEGLELRVSTLKQQLEEAEADLEKLKKGKQVVA
jgi:arsenite-transporting ATPase